MKGFGLLSLLLIIPSVVNAAASPQTDTANLIASLSQCALGCLAQTVPTVGCGLLDIPCQCASKNLTQIATACMLSNCTVAESLQLVHVDAEQCNRPHDSRKGIVKAIAIASAVVTFFMILLRIFARWWTVGVFWWDDWFHITAGIFVIPLTVYANMLAQHGLGSHLYDIDSKRAADILLWFYLVQIFWGTAILFVKMSILCLYLRIFPNRRFRMACFITMAFIIISWIVLFFIAVIQCIPVKAIWDLNIKNAKCISIGDISYANAAINIATEVVILVIPIPVLSQLQLSFRRKVALYALFSAGILVIVVASIRVPTLSSFVTFNDPTWNNVPTFLWSCAETTVVHICAAAPAVRKLFSSVRDHVSSVHYGKKSNGTSFGNSGSSGEEQSAASKGSRRRGGFDILTTSSVTRNSTTLEKAMREVEMENLERAASPTRGVTNLPAYTPPFHKHGQTTTTITADPESSLRETAIVDAIRRSNSRSNNLGIVKHYNSGNENNGNTRLPHSKFSALRTLSSSPLNHSNSSRQSSPHPISHSNHVRNQGGGSRSSPQPAESAVLPNSLVGASSSQDSILGKAPSQHSNDTRTTAESASTDEGNGTPGAGGRSYLNTLRVPTAVMDRSFLSLSSTDGQNDDARARGTEGERSWR